MNRGPRERSSSRNVSSSSNGSNLRNISQMLRSSSMDVVNRGSYLPSSSRRSNSMDRNRSFGKPLYKSTPKKPSFGNSFPRGSISRGSSISIKNQIKDPRLLSDKPFQKQCINKLVDYLEENNFPYAISRNSLLLPTKKDVEMIFQFLYKFWDPKYEVQKIEDEIPKIMKTLGYPFNIARSALVSITRMSWPSVLGAIMWLLDLNKSCSGINMDNYLISEDFEFEAHQSVLINYICSSYSMGFSDPDKDAAVFTELIRKKHGSSVDINVIKQENQDLEEFIQCEIAQQKEYELLIEENKKLEDDISQYQNYIEQMSEHIKSKTEVYEKIKEKKAAKDNELNELKAEVNRLEALYKSQGFDGEQALNFYQSQKDLLMNKLDQKRNKVKQEEKDYWDLEIEYAKLRDNAQTRCAEFTRRWSNLGNTLNNLLSEVFKNSQVPTAIKLSRDYSFSLPDFAFHTKFTDDIKPALSSAKQYLDEQTKRIKNIVSFQEHCAQQILLKISDKRQQIDLLAAQWKQKRREMDLKMEKSLQCLEDLKQSNQNSEMQTAKAHRNNKILQENIVNLKKTKDELCKRFKTKEGEFQLLQREGQHTLHNIQFMIDESIKKTQRMLQNAEKLMDNHMKFIKENPLPLSE